jgi:hypothetical protein
LKSWHVALAIAPLGWLVPDHYFPWLSAWADGVALSGLALAWLLCPARLAVSGTWIGFCAIAAATVALQGALGIVPYFGDMLVVWVYLAALLVAVGLGASRSALPGTPQAEMPLEVEAVAVSMAAVVSVGIAFNQWLGAVELGVFAAPLPPGSRPFANVGQPNHLCTIAFLGLCALGYLVERRRLGLLGFAVGALWLCAGMALTGSRTGWLQLASLALLARPMLGSPRLSVPTWLLLSVVTACFAFAAGLGELSSALGLDGIARPDEDLQSAGTRPAHWLTFAAAIAERPWLGFGWLQGAAAQQAGIDAVGLVGEQVDYAHNQLLDLVAWSGVPVGLVLIALVARWLVITWQRLVRPDAAWLCFAVIGMLIHALLEYPLTYAYFLVPFGLRVGADPPMPLWPEKVLAMLFVAVLAVLAVDYGRAEAHSRQLRMQLARIGPSQTPLPEARQLMLTQLQDFHWFAQTPARVDLSPAEVERMERVARRFGYPPVLFRMALVRGLRGEVAEAEHNLRLICWVHGKRHCREARESWVALVQQTPQLRSVSFPGERPRD